MIGVFDSGLGGLTVVREIIRHIPSASIVYVGDTARLPYGTKSPERITQYTIEGVQFLISRGAQAVVIACNSASAVAIPALRETVSVPIFEVVTPAVQATLQSGARHIGVIATNATVRSGVYSTLVRSIDASISVSAQACPLFVPLVEEGWADTPEARSIASSYLTPLIEHGIDSLILGCTHYPLMLPAIRHAVPDTIRIIDPATETARALLHTLSNSAILTHTEPHRFFVTDITERFADIASAWLGMPINLQPAELPHP